MIVQEEEDNAETLQKGVDRVMRIVNDTPADPTILQFSPLVEMHAYAGQFKALFPRMVNLVIWSMHARRRKAQGYFPQIPTQGPEHLYRLCSFARVMEVRMTFYLSSTCTIHFTVKGAPQLRGKPPGTKMEGWADLARVVSLAIVLPGTVSYTHLTLQTILLV